MWHEMGWGGLWFGWLLLIVLMVLIAWITVRFAGRTAAGPVAGRDQKPLEILKKRYARGEIDKKEYDQIKKDLNGE